MIEYRAFRNPDPPLLVELWNAALSGPRIVPVPSPVFLEYFTFAKQTFDPEGLVLALQEGKPVGMVHAGPAPRADETGVDPSTGVISLLGVVPSCRGQGIGQELLRRAEDYLRQRGVSTVLAGGMAPNNPFLFGLYGGCTSPGFLVSDSLARPFFEKHGYALARSVGLFQRSLVQLPDLDDARFDEYRQRYDIYAAPYRPVSWWRECVLGPVEAVEYRLEDTEEARTVGQMVMWDMDTFAMHWGQPCVGVIELMIEAPHRRQGLAKFLLVNVLRHLRERSFQRIEVMADLSCPASLALLSLFELEQVETGHCFRKLLS